MTIGAYVAPLSAILICYALIIWEVKVHADKFKKAASNMKVGANKANEEMNKQKKEVKTAKIAAIIIACWTIAWTPYAAVAMMGIASDGSYLTPIASQLPAIFAKSAAVYNPIGEKLLKKSELVNFPIRIEKVSRHFVFGHNKSVVMLGKQPVCLQRVYHGY
nr:rhabdomeric opsin [Dactylobiotus sp.]